MVSISVILPKSFCCVNYSRYRIPDPFQYAGAESLPTCRQELRRVLIDRHYFLRISDEDRKRPSWIITREMANSGLYSFATE